LNSIALSEDCKAYQDRKNSLTTSKNAHGISSRDYRSGARRLNQGWLPLIAGFINLEGHMVGLMPEPEPLQDAHKFKTSLEARWLLP
jgi:phosphoribosylformylglycinamidine (FGAM) synthase-like amidotransferase family enzyme